MKLFIIALVAIFAVALAAEEEYCYENVVAACKQPTKKQDPIKCNAKYGAIDYILNDLQSYVNTHISRSYEYLMMSTHYANYEKNRPGFEKLLRDLSDSKWDTAIELIKYITKRGGAMDFNERVDLGENPKTDGGYELYELESLALALDIEKKLATQAFKIHREATGRNQDYHDPEISSYIEEEFAHKQASTIRKLSGYTADLSTLLNGKDSSIALYLFDDYLAKQ